MYRRLINYVNTSYGKLVLFSLILYCVVQVYCIYQLSVTGDEQNYYTYARNIIKGKADKNILNGKPIYNSQKPVVAFNTIPRIVQQVVQPSLTKTESEATNDIINGRLISILLGLLLGIYIVVWATQLYGSKGGVLALLLYSLCPNILAHTALVSTDVYSYFIATAIMYHLWRNACKPSNMQVFLISGYLGLGQISKQSLLIFYPIAILFIIVQVYRNKLITSQKVKSIIKALVIITVGSLLLINVGFLFCNTGMPLSNYEFISARFSTLIPQLGWLSTIPIPLPQPYIQGFDIVSFNIETPPGVHG